jgi:hypothetical protein
MNPAMHPAMHPRKASGAALPPGDDLDALLRDWIQSEMPQTWPAAPIPSPTPVDREALAPRWRAPARSRLALAASVAILVTGSLFVGKSFYDERVPSILAPGTIGTGSIRGLPGKPKPDFRMKTELEQAPDGPTSIKIIIEELPAR